VCGVSGFGQIWEQFLKALRCAKGTWDENDHWEVCGRHGGGDFDLKTGWDSIWSIIAEKKEAEKSKMVPGIR
jgi:hypothetical protein